MVDWTAERVETLLAGYNDGSTMSRIAMILGHGVTRNAVIGKLNRMGHFRGHVVADPKTQKQRRKNRNKVIEESFGGNAGKPSNFISANIARRERAKAEHEFEAESVMDLPPDQSPHAVSLFDATDNQCRWPLNNPGPGFLFCGAPIMMEGCSWCTRHARMAYAPGKVPSRYAFSGR
jgi:GcrA cell cycle regulator